MNRQAFTLVARSVLLAVTTGIAIWVLVRFYDNNTLPAGMSPRSLMIQSAVAGACASSVPVLLCKIVKSAGFKFPNIKRRDKTT